MRTSQLLLRFGPTAAAAVLPIALTTPSAAAAPTGISVSTTGSSVTVTTDDCPNSTNGTFGTASLLSSGQANFSQGRQATLTGTSANQSASWANVGPGTYTVIGVCKDGTTAGTQSVIVTAATPTIAATASPARGVMGGVGGATREYGTVTLVGGGALVALGTGAAVWYLRRRAKPHRL
ncbi:MULTISPECIES: hypothetical protein [Streptomyces]|uniref:Secreted protein n=1 Tax=Streptomyces stelliscabiei TaxID=146820 RepID=A0A8I0P029_9ACTN|nr:MULTISPECIES: hypothetical protein [Streptomyces]KND26771.1 hypothetical protein IQ64_46150 [Streptomyces stelliscabiei]MBE1594954.1 hypothetical protein [Streptomyces stelliscabiei]MDX2520701.1 hypothetical protein [Streptomyces stelliscabiei]MDX2551083.1 hypothetical protein [Streptomyces stelliscabiei]MDX2614870.1 hypothetical protein [Streptomyces stelliscabiei]